jgi:hypothetical protein
MGVAIEGDGDVTGTRWKDVCRDVIGDMMEGVMGRDVGTRWRTEARGSMGTRWGRDGDVMGRWIVTDARDRGT